MKKMHSVLKAIDIFSTKVTFSVERDNGYSTALGSFLSIVSLVIFIVLFLILGKDFLYKENARTSASTMISPESEKFSLRDLNLTIAISLEKSETKQIDLNGGFFWSDFSYTYNFYNETLGKDQSKLNSLKLQPCNSLSYQPSANFSSRYSCIEFPAETYLGQEGNSSFFFLYSMFNCEKKMPMGIGAKCNTIKRLTEVFKQENSVTYMFNIFFPVLYFDPRDKERPAKVNYELLIFPFDFNLQRTDNFYFHKTVINEDKGWWFEDNHNETYWTVESRDYFFNYKSNDDLSVFLSSSQMYQLALTTSLKVNYYSRSYMKIQDVLAVVTALLRALLIVFEFICMLVNMTLLRYYIFSKLFCTMRLNSYKSNISFFSNLNVSNANLCNASKSKDAHVSTLVGSKAKPSTPPNKKTFVKVKSYSRCFALRRVLGPWAFREKERFLLKKFDQGTAIVREKIDLNNYLRMIFDVIMLQRSVFNEAQCHSLNYLKKVNLFNPQEVESTFNTKKTLSDELMHQYGSYFVNQLDRDEGEKAKDMLLLERMKDSYKDKLFLKESE